MSDNSSTSASENEFMNENLTEDNGYREDVPDIDVSDDRSGGSGNNLNIYPQIIKPALSWLVSLLLFVLTLPVLLVLAALVSVNIGAPALERVKCRGKDGRLFTRYDLRTETLDAQGEPTGNVGKLGHFLRVSGWYRIPNLINCLRSEMTITGPYPAPADFINGEDERRKIRSSVRPGIACPEYPEGCDPVETDAQYVENKPFGSDGVIVCKTIARMFRGRCFANIPDYSAAVTADRAVTPRRTAPPEIERMYILLMTLEDVQTVKRYTPVCDLARKLIDRGHRVTVLCPACDEKQTMIIGEDDSECRIVRVSTADMHDTKKLGRLTAYMLLDRQMTAAASMELDRTCFDMVINAAPPSALEHTCEYICRRDGAFCCLLQSDLLPQLAVDLGAVKEGMLLHNGMRDREERMYSIADRIICSSDMSREYLLKSNPWIEAESVSVGSLGIDIHPTRLRQADKNKVREHFELPYDKKIFVSIGELDEMHDVELIKKCLFTQNDLMDIHIVIAGSGDGYHQLLEYAQQFGSNNITLMNDLSDRDTELLLGGCDVAMLFGSSEISYPTLPSELLYYMQAGLPVLAVTDIHSAVRVLLKEYECGWWACSDNADNFADAVNFIVHNGHTEQGKNAYRCLKRDYGTEALCDRIMACSC